MAPEYEVWTADLPWRGAGVPGWPQRPPDTWIDQAVRQLPGNGADVIVAHSFAANGTLAWLDRCGWGVTSYRPHGHMPRGVVLAAPFYRAAAEHFDWDTISYYLNHFDRILQHGVRVRSGSRLSDEIEHDMALKVRDRIGCHGWMRFFDSYLATPALRTERMRLPFVVIGGSEDFAAFPRDAHALGEALPEADVHILAGAGHFTMAERPRTFADLTNSLIRTVSARNEADDHNPAMEYKA
ncbi:hypothetical protein DB35_25980 [Streptomyces abyssalis]|uniref:AB hydrolase-1 domain-containing protein n=1 Tax=Streptomyces abyssalis TaxID=933944 RepID=A0A1E7JQR0_9ACTN|nr:hypothetical protein DB35_25980 [Streptomyces abyssalis]OEU90600.1 hypothetical protein AN215_07585 [Streptomyces abyssalis]OEV21095.1 hypothetical protein AN219_27270 [Streptomyces nanshensis]